MRTFLRNCKNIILIEYVTQVVQCACIAFYLSVVPWGQVIQSININDKELDEYSFFSHPIAIKHWKPLPPYFLVTIKILDWIPLKLLRQNLWNVFNIMLTGLNIILYWIFISSLKCINIIQWPYLTIPILCMSKYRDSKHVQQDL